MSVHYFTPIIPKAEPKTVLETAVLLQNHKNSGMPLTPEFCLEILSYTEHPGIANKVFGLIMKQLETAPEELNAYLPAMSAMAFEREPSPSLQKQLADFALRYLPPEANGDKFAFVYRLYKTADTLQGSLQPLYREFVKAYGNMPPKVYLNSPLPKILKNRARPPLSLSQVADEKIQEVIRSLPLNSLNGISFDTPEGKKILKAIAACKVANNLVYGEQRQQEPHTSIRRYLLENGCPQTAELEIKEDKDIMKSYLDDTDLSPQDKLDLYITLYGNKAFYDVKLEQGILKLYAECDAKKYQLRFKEHVAYAPYMHNCADTASVLNKYPDAIHPVFKTAQNSWHKGDEVSKAVAAAYAANADYFLKRDNDDYYDAFIYFYQKLPATAPEARMMLEGMKDIKDFKPYLSTANKGRASRKKVLCLLLHAVGLRDASNDIPDITFPEVGFNACCKEEVDLITSHQLFSLFLPELLKNERYNDFRNLFLRDFYNSYALWPEKIAVSPDELLSRCSRGSDAYNLWHDISRRIQKDGKDYFLLKNPQYIFTEIKEYAKKAESSAITNTAALTNFKIVEIDRKNPGISTNRLAELLEATVEGLCLAYQKSMEKGQGEPEDIYDTLYRFRFNGLGYVSGISDRDNQKGNRICLCKNLEKVFGENIPPRLRRLAAESYGLKRYLTNPQRGVAGVLLQKGKGHD